MARQYDAIVVGARCAGAPTAMLLARSGQRVLLLDRAGFPSDTISTHLIHPTGVAALRRWGLLDRITASGCPPISTYGFDFGAFTIQGSPLPVDHTAYAYAPRRTVLDKVLIDAAAEAGVEVREHVTVQDLLVDDGQVTGVRGRSNERHRPFDERASLVIGADGRHSVVAQKVRAATYRAVPSLAVSYYAYWSGLAIDRFDVHIRPGRTIASIPTNDGLACQVVAWPRAEMESNRDDIEGHYLRAIDQVPAVAERLRSARRETAFVGMAVPNFYRTPSGPGWALAGDAGYDRDPCTAHGISDAFRDAESLTQAWSSARDGHEEFSDAMGRYQRERDERTSPMYDLTCQLGTLAPPPPDQARLLAAVAGNASAMQGFVSMFAGTLPVTSFFSDENVGAILAAAN